MSTHFYARARRSQGAWLEAITGEHLKAMPEELRAPLEEELTDALVGLKDRTLPAVLVAVDSPQPTRAYALLVRVGRQEVVGYAHALAGATDDVYRALFSGMAVQAALLGGGPSIVALTPDTSSPEMLEVAERLGAPYAVVAGPSPAEVSEELDEADTAAQALHDETLPPIRCGRCERLDLGFDSDDIPEHFPSCKYRGVGDPETTEPEPERVEGATGEEEADGAEEHEPETQTEEPQGFEVDLTGQGELSEEEALALLEEEDAAEEESTPELRCTTCERTFKNRSGLASHMKSHE